MEFSALLCISVVALIFIFILRKRHYVPKRSSKGMAIPEPPALPFIGHSLSEDLRNLHFSCEKYAEKYGKLFQLRIFGKTLVVINDSKLVRKAFASEIRGRL